jgi:hypothetical protein
MPISNAPRMTPAVVEMRQQVDDRGHHEHPDPPLTRVVPAGLARHHLAHRPAELEVEEGRDQWLEEDEEPRDVESRPRAERTGRVRVETAGRRFELRELADRDSGAEASDQREQHRERECLLRGRNRDVDRVGDSRSRCHMGDRLKQHLWQPNRVDSQTVERPGNPASFHLDASCCLDLPLPIFPRRRIVCPAPTEHRRDDVDVL